ncbi:MAG TPA: hypothetical protein VFX17_04045 [Patescibacteria group bacterium]|nr:hypothetical protein [Patescibacteria group bacterium]
MNIFPEKLSWKLSTLYTTLVLVILGTSSLFMYRYLASRTQIKTPTNLTPSTSPQTQTPTDSTGTTSYLDTSFDLGKCKTTMPVVPSKSGQVQWIEPKYQPDMKIFESGDMGNDYLGGEASYLVGRVMSGKYKGGDVFLTTVPYAGFFGSEQYDHEIKLNGKIYYLSKYSEDDLDNKNSEVTPLKNVTIDKQFDLIDLDLPQIIHLDNPVVDLVQLPPYFGFTQYADQRFCGDNKVQSFYDNSVDVIYTLNDAGRANLFKENKSTPTSYYVKAPDSTQRVYVIKPSFMQNNDIPSITWNDIGVNTQKYTYQNMTGCGPLAFTDISNVYPSDLIQTGTTSDNQTVFEYKDSNNSGLKEVYNKTDMYEPNLKPSYDVFKSNHPVFFWKDPFGYYVRFINEQYEASAYCG